MIMSSTIVPSDTVRGFLFPSLLSQRNPDCLLYSFEAEKRFLLPNIAIRFSGKRTYVCKIDSKEETTLPNNLIQADKKKSE